MVWALCQLMACQSTTLWETAPAGVATAVICFVCSVGWPISLVMQDPHGKSARFRVGRCCHRLNPYPPHYRMAFASSGVPYPHPYRPPLRLAFPCGRDTGLPRSARVPLDELGSACPPVTRHLRETKGELPPPGHLPFWSKPLSPFGLLVLTTFISGSHVLAMSSHPSS